METTSALQLLTSCKHTHLKFILVAEKSVEITYLLSDMNIPEPRPFENIRWVHFKNKQLYPLFFINSYVKPIF